MPLTLLFLYTLISLIAFTPQSADAVRVNNLRDGPTPCTALEKACAAGDLAKVKLLLQQGSKINEKDSRGSSPVIIAVAYYQMPVVQYLVDHGADVNQKDRPSDLFPLHFACFANITMVQYLLDHGANVDASGGGFGSALNIAVRQNDLKMAELLLQRHADTETTEVVTSGSDSGKTITRNQVTPLIDAAANGQLAMIALLVKYHANLNSTNEQSRLPTMATGYPSGPLQSLPGPPLQQGDTALDAATEAGHLDVASYLKSLGAKRRTP